jgi:hypothetical protein
MKWEVQFINTSTDLLKKFCPHYGPGVDSASNRNEYQEHFLGGGGARGPVHRANLTTFMCWLSRNSGSPNLLEPSGNVQACTGIALPFALNK